MRQIVLDTETTGLDWKSGDRLIEIAGVELLDRKLTGRHYHVYVNPQRDIDAGAVAVHGITSEFLADKPLFGARAGDLLEFIGDAPLVAHNASFDFSFLNAELALCGMEPVSLDRMIDTVALARARHPGAKNSLDALCNRYGIDSSRRTKHGALLDSEILAEVYAELSGGKQSSLSLGQFGSEPAGEMRATTSGLVQKIRALPEIHLLTEAEFASHQAFIGEMGEKAIWNAYTSTEAEKS